MSLLYVCICVRVHVYVSVCTCVLYGLTCVSVYVCVLRPRTCVFVWYVRVGHVSTCTCVLLVTDAKGSGTFQGRRRTDTLGWRNRWGARIRQRDPRVHLTDLVYVGPYVDGTADGQSYPYFVTSNPLRKGFPVSYRSRRSVGSLSRGDPDLEG